MDIARPKIPTFGLFGEESAPDLSEMLHWETIEARSRKYDWEISPHCHPALDQVLFVKEGEVELVLGTARKQVPGPVIVLVPHGFIHGFRFSEETQGLVLTMAESYLRLFASKDPLRMAFRDTEVIVPDAALAARIDLLAREILVSGEVTPDANENAYRRALVEAWLRLVMNPLWNGSGSSHGERLVRRFQALVETHYRSHSGVGFYARQLGCTPRNLARLCRAELGMTPLEIVNQRLALEARRLLTFTNASCAEVADELGFEDPSYFSRFYLRMTGQRPSANMSGRQADPQPLPR